MKDRLKFFWNRMRERLWFRPLIVSVLSVGGAFIAKAVDTPELAEIVPSVSLETNQKLLSIMASSMLVIATFTVASMVSAYSSASSTATPRSFPLIVADDASQAALSSFIGAFIFSIVALVALTNEYYGEAGQFLTFVLTMTVFGWVIVTFVRWVDQAARLGRMSNVIEKVEEAALSALDRRRREPTMGAADVPAGDPGYPVYGAAIGYVQRIDLEELQELAEHSDVHITLAALPGTFSSPGRVLAYIHDEVERNSDSPDSEQAAAVDTKAIVAAFRIGDVRVYDNDPRFGLIVLSEIAARALSPAVNDPGTAIQIIGTFVRLFARWADPLESDNKKESVALEFDRVHAPRLAVADMFDDAFTPIGRDGAGNVEVQTRLQKAFAALYFLDDRDMQDAAERHSQLALKRAAQAMALPEELALVQKAAQHIAAGSQPNDAGPDPEAT